MQTDRWCVNAAALCRFTLQRLAVKSYPVHAEVMHLNAAATEHLRMTTHEAPAGYRPPLVPDGQEPFMIYARLSVVAPDDIGAEDSSSPDGLAGHLLTYVPTWGAYLDPSAHQFTRGEHGVELPPGHVWHGVPDPPPDQSWQRPDGGVSAITPTGLRRFRHAPGWQRRDYHAAMVDEILNLVQFPLPGDADTTGRA
jgi:hypothetical protein